MADAAALTDVNATDGQHHLHCEPQRESDGKRS
jgi:hypothetical protein